MKTTCKELCSLQTDALRETIVERMGSDLMRKTLDLQLIIFTQIVTFLVEELLKGLHAKLMTLVWSLHHIIALVFVLLTFVSLLCNLLYICDCKLTESDLQRPLNSEPDDQIIHRAAILANSLIESLYTRLLLQLNYSSLKLTNLTCSTILEHKEC